ncbi:MAG: cobalamin-dependent protein [Candidatus Coatesbacteria bacterium]|nr:cobalamin-dependent protein [Candidatus Coatesbacteria bacterium]
MKILLINPPFKYTVQSCQPKILEEGLDFLPPLGLMYIASSLEKKNDCQVEILDSQVEQLSYEQLEEEIKKRKPDVVGITTMTFTLLDVIKTAWLAKRINPNTKVILGGPHVIIYPEETISIPEVDFVVLGEGEDVIGRLLDNINNPEELKKIKGIAFKQEDRIINTGIAEPIADLDQLPLPARHLTRFKKYFSVFSPNATVTTMFTSRGCPYQCLFCDRPTFGKNFRAHSAQRVVEEMAQCQQMGIKEIFIYDDTFGVDRQRVLDICRLIKETEVSIAWDIRTRVNTVDEELLRALKEAGCQRIHYGVEAGTQKVLDVLRKGITPEMARNAVALTKRIGIQTYTYFMLGSPTETKQDILATIKLMKELDTDYAHVSITTPFPATDLYRLALREKVIGYDVWQEFASDPKAGFLAPIWEKELTRTELFSLLKKAYWSFYLRPTYILKKIRQLKSGAELLRKTKAALRLIKIPQNYEGLADQSTLH